MLHFLPKQVLNVLQLRKNDHAVRWLVNDTQKGHLKLNECCIPGKVGIKRSRRKKKRKKEAKAKRNLFACVFVRNGRPCPVWNGFVLWA